MLREARRTVVAVVIEADGETWTWPTASTNELRAALLAGFAGHYAAAIVWNSETLEAFRDGVAMRREGRSDDDVIGECMRRWP